MDNKSEKSSEALTPHKEAPALKVSLKARAAKVVYPPAEPPVIQRRSPSTFPLCTWIGDYIVTLLTDPSTINVGNNIIKIKIITKYLAQLQQSLTSTIPHCPKSRSRYSLP